MNNPFKEILHQEELPKMLREKVMDDISFIKLAIDMADLFAVKCPETIENFFKTKER